MTDWLDSPLRAQQRREVGEATTGRENKWSTARDNGNFTRRLFLDGINMVSIVKLQIIMKQQRFFNATKLIPVKVAAFLTNKHISLISQMHENGK